MKSVLLRLIAVYQRFVSPALPVVTLGTCSCRFTPSCSHYAADAVATHGALRGSWLAVRRLLKCGPWHPGGIDLVPAVGTAGSAVRGFVATCSVGRSSRRTSPRFECRAV
jgi:putative membrane protein insertion efficiency factor